MILTWLALLIQGLVYNIVKDEAWFVKNVELVPLIIILITSVLFMICAFKIVGRRLAFIIIIGYIGRIMLMFWDIYCGHIWMLPNSGSDTEMFLRFAVDGYLTNNYGRGGTYSQFIGLIFKLFGPQRIIAQFVNVLLGVMAVLVVFKILKKYNVNANVKKILVVVGMLMPNYALMNSILLRETLIIFILTISFYFFVLWFKENRFSGFILGVSLSMLAATFHSGAIAAAVGYAVCMVLYDRNSNSFRFKRSSIFIIVVCILAYFIIDAQFGDSIFRKFHGKDISDITELANQARGGSGYSISIHTGNSILDMIVNTPIRIFYFLLAPLPWYWRGLGDIIAFFFSALFYGYSYYLGYRALKNEDCENRELIIVFLIIAVISAFIFAWGVKNAGTALRHREKFFIYYLALFALCYRYRIILKVRNYDT